MNSLLVALIAISESVGVGLVGVASLPLLRLLPVGYSLLAVVGITGCAMNTSTVTTVLVTRSVELPLAVHLAINLVSGAVAIVIGLLLGRSVMNGGRRLADATRLFGDEQRFRTPDDDSPTAELAELARELTITSDELADSRQRERASEAAQRRLVAWISRDLRSPLARLRAVTESIEDGVVDDLPEYCGKIRADTERLTGMVDDLFELSRIQAGTLRLEPRDVALDDLISDEVAGLDVLAGKHGVRLRAEVIEPVVVRVDDRAMTRVLNNLLVNAIQYSPAGTTVSVGVRELARRAVVSIADECGGIAEQDLGSVFDTGWSADTGEDPVAVRGGGLGLAIAQGIVEAHNGSVSARNVPGGCCFEIRLPLAAS